MFRLKPRNQEKYLEVYFRYNLPAFQKWQIIILILNFFVKYIQLTLAISKSKGPSKTLRDIRTSTYQVCSIEVESNLNNQILQMTM